MRSMVLNFHSMVVLINENSMVLNGTSLAYTIVASVDKDDIRLLSSEEQRLWYSDKQYRRTGNDWFAGRVAGKFSIKRWAIGMHNLKLIEKEISIINHSNGSPFIRWPITFELRASISISHKDGIGFSVVTGESGYIGCDVERNIFRSPRCIPYFSTHCEYAIWEGWNPDHCDSVSLLWTCKEAAIKCLRSAVKGRISMESVIVSPLSANRYKVEYDRFIGSGMWWTDHKYIFAICRVIELGD